METYSSLSCSASLNAASSTRDSRARELGLRAARDLRERSEHALELALQLLDGDPELLQHWDRAALGLAEQRAQQVGGLDLAVAARARERLGLPERLLALDRELVVTHVLHA